MLFQMGGCGEHILCSWDEYDTDSANYIAHINLICFLIFKYKLFCISAPERNQSILQRASVARLAIWSQTLMKT